jgi:hypothetical protein
MRMSRKTTSTSVRGRGRLADTLAAVQDAQGVRGVRRLQHGPDPGVLTEQVGELLERRVLVVDRENDQAAGVVVTVHDPLILHVRAPAVPVIFPRLRGLW